MKARVLAVLIVFTSTGMVARAQGVRDPFSGSVPSMPAMANPMTLTLRDVLDRALKHNLGIVTLEHEIGRVDAARIRSLSGLMPNVEARAGDTVQTVNLAAFGFDSSVFPDVPPVIGPFTVFDARLALSQPVIDMSALNDLRRARHELDAARLDARNGRDIVILVVTDLYLHAAMGARRIDAIRRQATIAEELLKLANNLHDAGVTPGIDVVRARVQQQAQRQRLIAAENDFAKRKLQLARAIGLPAAQPIEIGEREAAVAAPQTSVEQAIQQAKQSRADYRALLARVEAAEADQRAAHAEALPSVRAHVDFGAIGSTLRDARRTYAVSGTVSVPLFDTGRHSREAQTAAALLQRQAEAADFAERIETDVRTAFLDVQAAEQQLAVARERLDLTGQELSLAQTRFAAGVTSNLEVIQAQDSVAIATENEIESVYAADVARAALTRAIGSQ